MDQSIQPVSQNSRVSTAYSYLYKTFAVLLDVIVIVSFVIIGENSHNRGATMFNIVRISLPLAAAYFAVMLIVTTDLGDMKTAAISSTIAVPLAIFLRIQIGSAEFPFILIAWVYLTTFFVGWRFILTKLRPVKA